MFFISTGVQIGKMDSNNMYKVKNHDHIFELPEIIFLFWEQFLDGEFYSVAKDSFLQTGLPVELFNQTLQILVEDGLIIKKDDNANGLRQNEVVL